jgi:hypothetical protein
MNKKTKSSTERPAWNALVAHHQKVRDLHLRKLFADDPTRGERIIPELESKEEPTLAHDSSTNNLIHRYRKFKEAL